MENNFEYLNSLIKKLNPNEKLEINSLGEIKIAFRDSTGKKHTKRAGNLFENSNQIQPLPGKMWVNVYSDGIKSWAKFGEKLPKNNKKENINLNTLVEFFLSFCDFTQNPNYYKDANNYNYKVYTCGNVKGYFLYDNLRYIEINGVKSYVTQKLPKLETIKLDPKLVNV